MRMNWEMISTLVDSIGALAVVTSLVFLGIQVRTQNHERRVASVHEINNAYRNMLSSLSEPDLAAIVVKGLDGYATLDPVEKIQAVSYLVGGLKLYEEAYYQYQQGRLDRFYWEGMLRQLEDTMSSDTMRNVWSLRCHQFGDEFRSLVDGLPQQQNTLW
ncbi:hypothetical protein KT71_16781 [Congregibacter litoralis KT71]|uniref:DUF4760 domain-containing protein n=2 Tax=Congregibacter TaxID=393661 RepID=A4A3S1_9GAMM|nr:hypothetical protein KT71_16781 [Congregibacter litoralis KT71]